MRTRRQTRKKSPAKCEPSLYVRRVGIITMPSGPLKKKHGSAYITKNNIDWFNARGVEVIPIPYNTPDPAYYFERINGLYLQGGPTYDPDYIETTRKFLQLAVDANNAGDYFPVWGTCHGFQMFLMIIGKMYPLEDFDAKNSYMAHLTLTGEAVKSRLYRAINQDLLDYVSSPKHVFFSHGHGISVATFRANKELARTFRLLSTTRDRRGVEYVSSIEARHFPFYGTQFHPERQPVMEPFRDFFLHEIYKNHHDYHAPIDAAHRILEKAPACPETKPFGTLYRVQRCATRRNPKLLNVFQASGCYFF